MRRESTSGHDDLALAQRAQHDRRAFDALFDRYADRVHRLAVRRTETAGEAEALAARMLERIFVELDRYRGELSLDAWVLARCKRVMAGRRAAEPPRAATQQAVWGD